MTSRSKRKGDSAEREIAGILTDQLGGLVRRRLGAGRRDDTGDLDGLPGTTVEVKAYADITRAVREGLDDCVSEQTNAGTPFGVAFIRRPGGRWFAAMTVEQFCALYREAT
jgi:hypothetical protein